MPGPVIMRLAGHPGARKLACEGVVALVRRSRLEPGTLVRVWLEEYAAWVDAVVERVDRVSYGRLAEYVGLSGYGSPDEWARREEERHKGSLPGWILVLRSLRFYGSCG